MKGIITADLHFDFNNRLDDMATSVMYLVEKAIAAKHDFFVIAGDGYKTWRPLPIEMERMHKIIRALTSNKIEVFIIVGNHDYPENGEYEGIHCFSELKNLSPDKVYVIDKPEVVIVKEDVHFLCIPHLGNSVLNRRPYAEVYEEILKQLTLDSMATSSLGKAINRILISHVYVREARVGNCDLQVSSSKQIPLGILTSETAKNLLDLVVLGDIHKPQRLAETPPVVYVGSPDRVDFGEAQDVKGALFLNIENGKVDYQFIQTPARNFVEMFFEIGAKDRIRTDKFKGVSEDYVGVDILSQIDSYGDKLIGAIAKVTVICSEEVKKDVSENWIREVLQRKGVHQIKSINFDIARPDTVREPLLTESITPMSALEVWVEKQGYPELTKQSVLLAGRKIVNG